MKQGQELSFDGFDDEGRPVLITRAAPAYEEQHRQRVRKYLTLMSFRVPALILAAVAYGIWHNGLLSLAIIVLSIPLPWMAVLIANDRPPRRAEEPRRYESKRRIPLFPTAEHPAIEGMRPEPPRHDADESPHDTDDFRGDVPR
ncbi:MAG: DUF3099 domain-containing protein [Mycobacterium sp.]